MEIKDIIFSLIKSEIGYGEADPAAAFCDKEILYRTCERHDIAQIIGDALIKLDAFSEEEDKIKKKFRANIFLAIYRETQLETVGGIAMKTLINNGIKFVPLKGAIIRKLYPQPWMRTSCDIDILVGDNDFDRALACLKKDGFIVERDRNYHDVSLYYGDAHVELHFNICENMPQMDVVLSEIWDNVEQYNGCEYRESKEFFVFHHIAHMAYHIKAGGCGIRPFVDLWLLRNKNYYDEEKLKAFLDRSELTTFYERVIELIDVWFNGGKRSEKTANFEDYVISGGIYGNLKNKITMGVAASKKSKLKYVFKSAFPGYKMMKILYPALEKHKVLLPFCYIHRIIKKLFGKNGVKVRGRFNSAKNYSETDINFAASLLDDLGIKNQ
ncbi:MAG: nucleotidyltransferase family protein [Clostridia bacterium]|nr:nucleotidyltransferase family protein [Clostridia bacterium]